MSEETQHKIKAYDKIEAGISKIRDTLKTVPDLKDNENFDANYTKVKDTIKATKTIVKEIEEARLVEKRKILHVGKLIDVEAERLTGEVKEHLGDWIDAKKKVDDVEKERKEEIKQAKAKRVSDIKDRIDSIERSTVEVVGKHSGVIKAQIESIINEDVEDGSFEEFQDDAIVAKQMALETLDKMLVDAEKFEELQAKAKVEKEKLDKERAEFEAKKKEQEEKEAAEESKRREEEDRKQDEQRKKDRELAEVRSLNSEIAGYKEYLIAFLNCKTADDMLVAEKQFQDDVRVTKERFGDLYDNAISEFNIVSGRMNQLISDKTKEEAEQNKQNEEAQRLREAEDKRIAEAKAEEQKQIDIENDAKRQAIMDKQYLEDVKVNWMMRDEAKFELILETADMEGSIAPTILKFLEDGKIPHIKVQWNTELLKKEAEDNEKPT